MDKFITLLYLYIFSFVFFLCYTQVSISDNVIFCSFIDFHFLTEKCYYPHFIPLAPFLASRSLATPTPTPHAPPLLTKPQPLPPRLRRIPKSSLPAKHSSRAMPPPSTSPSPASHGSASPSPVSAPSSTSRTMTPSFPRPADSMLSSPPATTLDPSPACSSV